MKFFVVILGFTLALANADKPELNRVCADVKKQVPCEHSALNCEWDVEGDLCKDGPPVVAPTCADAKSRGRCMTNELDCHWDRESRTCVESRGCADRKRPGACRRGENCEWDKETKTCNEKV